MSRSALRVCTTNAVGRVRVRLSDVLTARAGTVCAAHAIRCQGGGRTLVLSVQTLVHMVACLATVGRRKRAAAGAHSTDAVRGARARLRHAQPHGASAPRGAAGEICCGRELPVWARLADTGTGQGRVSHRELASGARRPHIGARSAVIGGRESGVQLARTAHNVADAAARHRQPFAHGTRLPRGACAEPWAGGELASGARCAHQIAGSCRCGFGVVASGARFAHNGARLTAGAGRERGAHDAGSTRAIRRSGPRCLLAEAGRAGLPSRARVPADRAIVLRLL